MPDLAQNPIPEQILPKPEVVAPVEQIEISSLRADQLALEEAEKSPALRDEEGEQESIPTEQEVKAFEKDPVLVEIEGILEKDLKDIFMSLPAETKPLFKQKGEQIAKAITDAIKLNRLNSDEIMGMIFDWLKLIPGVNLGYLEQEAGLKTRKILEYYNVLNTKPQA
ncbi:MAG: hypothetical protein WCW31_01250 [Patescibacteria group bacterium]|jgi:hypothetical protein